MFFILRKQDFFKLRPIYEIPPLTLFSTGVKNNTVASFNDPKAHVFFMQMMRTKTEETKIIGHFFLDFRSQLRRYFK